MKQSVNGCVLGWRDDTIVSCVINVCGKNLVAAMPEKLFLDAGITIAQGVAFSMSVSASLEGPQVTISRRAPTINPKTKREISDLLTLL